MSCYDCKYRNILPVHPSQLCKATGEYTMEIDGVMHIHQWSKDGEEMMNVRPVTDCQYFSRYSQEVSRV